MIFFRNDYGEGCIAPIAQLLKDCNNDSHPGYGEDDYCKKAAEILQSKFPDTPCDIHFVISGTLTNLTAIRHALRSHQGVIACDTAHIFLNEGGAIEATGHKILVAPNSNGKLTAASVARIYDTSCKKGSAAFLEPKLVYISNATEMGTVYSRQELEDLSRVCKERGMYLMMDGARIAPALMCGVDYTLNDIAKWCDVFTVGGTKNGALFGEAIAISNPELQPSFRHVMKQSGAMLAKGWLLGLQFIGLFERDDFYTCADHANKMARQIQDEIIALGYPLYMKSSTNLIFVVLNKIQYAYLKERVDFEDWGTWDDDIIIRLVCSWHTKQEAVDLLKRYLQEAMALSLNSRTAEIEEEEADSLKC